MYTSRLLKLNVYSIPISYTWYTNTIKLPSTYTIKINKSKAIKNVKHRYI